MTRPGAHPALLDADSVKLHGGPPEHQRMDDQLSHYRNKLAWETDSWDLFEALRSGEKILVIDTRSGEAFAREHIPTAINLPHRSMDASNTTDLDREILYVTYCDGIGCNASTKGALKMAELGFRVTELIGGLEWWRRDGYQTEGDHATPGRQIS